MKILRLISRIIAGTVFMFSGFVKAVDPLGSAYKFSDYFTAFHLDFLKPLALVLAIMLFTAEFISGFAVLSGYRQKTGIWGIMILMLIFTPLTLVLALSNPVSDCGCFGDAVHLTNWQTFWKNVVLMVFTIILFTGWRQVRSIFSPLKEWLIISVIILLFVIFSLLNIRHLQLFDFLPYKIGTNIPESMVIPEGKAVDEYSTTFIYEKDGMQKEFTLENYPADDTTWVFVDQKSVLVKKGYEPPIHDFSITSPDGRDIANEILARPGYTLLMITVKLNDADPEHLEQGFELGAHCINSGLDFYLVTASGTGEISKYQNVHPVYTGDETTLKTVIRSNPGYMLLNQGNIAGKWSWADIPSKEQFSDAMTPELVNRMNNKSPVLVVYSVFLTVAIILLLAISFRASRTE